MDIAFLLCCTKFPVRHGSVPDLHITVLAMGTAQHRFKLLKGYSPLLRGDLFLEFRPALFTQPAVALRGYPKFHIYPFPL